MLTPISAVAAMGGIDRQPQHVAFLSSTATDGKATLSTTITLGSGVGVTTWGAGDDC